MIGYLARRIGVSIVVVLGITVVTFVLLHTISGTPGRAVLGLRASPQAVAAFNRTHGYDEALVKQYWNYLSTLLQGNLGYSYKLDQSVKALLSETAGKSAILSGSALLLSLLIAIPLGIFQAVRRNTVGDYALTSAAMFTYSMPSFFLGLLLIFIFGLKLNILPTEAAQTSTVLGVFEQWRSMVLPVATLTLISVASYSRYMRSSALDALAQDYVMVAKSKGLPQRLVLWSHLLRNACLPIVTLVGLSIPTLLAGNLITETVFNFPGVGLLFYNSLQNEDYPVLLAYTLVAGVLTVLGNFIADLALSVVDPRIRIA